MMITSPMLLLMQAVLPNRLARSRLVPGPTRTDPRRPNNSSSNRRLNNKLRRSHRPPRTVSRQRRWQQQPTTPPSARSPSSSSKLLLLQVLLPQPKSSNNSNNNSKWVVGGPATAEWEAPISIITFRAASLRKTWRGRILQLLHNNNSAPHKPSRRQVATATAASALP